MAAAVEVLSKRGQRIGTTNPGQSKLQTGFWKAYMDAYSKENPQVLQGTAMSRYVLEVLRCWKT